MTTKKSNYSKTSSSSKATSSSQRLVTIVSIFIAVIVFIFYLVAPEKAMNMFGVDSSKGIETNSFIINDFKQAYPALPADYEYSIMNHEYYGFAYSEKYKDSYWVTYLLTKKMVTTNNVNRDDEEFTKDPLLEDNYALTSDYSGSGYDRGHLCPAGDMNFNQTAMSQSFFMTNISPQKPGLNRQIWKELEEKVRDWAVDNDSIIIITGPIFSQKPRRIGNNKVAVPSQFYKVVADISNKDGYKAIAFIFDNKDYNTNEQFMDYAISVDELEQQTGIDFFANYQNDDVDKIESSIDKNLWK